LKIINEVDGFLDLIEMRVSINLNFLSIKKELL